MYQQKNCNCAFHQSNTSCQGERIRVNGGCGCTRTTSTTRQHCQCQNPCRPNMCHPRPCPTCEQRCASQYRNCMRHCRWEHEDCGCGCGCSHSRPMPYQDGYDANEEDEM